MNGLLVLKLFQLLNDDYFLFAANLGHTIPNVYFVMAKNPDMPIPYMIVTHPRSKVYKST